VTTARDYEKNKERVAIYNRKYYAAHREELNARQRDAYHKRKKLKNKAILPLRHYKVDWGDGE
jgi:hypothetical protein